MLEWRQKKKKKPKPKTNPTLRVLPSSTSSLILPLLHLRDLRLQSSPFLVPPAPSAGSFLRSSSSPPATDCNSSWQVASSSTSTIDPQIAIQAPANQQSTLPLPLQVALDFSTLRLLSQGIFSFFFLLFL